MPSFPHDALVFLFQQDPRLAVELLRATSLEIPSYATARLQTADLSQLVPTEYRADAVVVLEDDGGPVLVIVIEVQLLPDERKRYTWPVYQTVIRAKLETTTLLLVITPSETTARWAERPLDLGGGNLWRPLVIPLSRVPPVEDGALAERCPELGVLSVMAHGTAETSLAVRVATAALQGLSRLTDSELLVLYTDLIDSHLGEAARKALGMILQGYQYQSPFGNQRFAEGKLEGKLEGERELLRRLLSKKFGATPDELARLDDATVEDLELWSERLLNAAALADIFC